MLAVLLASAPLYLTYKMYRTGRESDARQGAILEAACDAILTMDQNLNIREFNPAAEQMFGYRRTDILGRNVDLLIMQAIGWLAREDKPEPTRSYRRTYP